VLLLSPADLEQCRGSIERLIEAIEHAVERAGLAWPSG